MSQQDTTLSLTPNRGISFRFVIYSRIAEERKITPTLSANKRGFRARVRMRVCVRARNGFKIHHRRDFELVLFPL